MGVLLADDSLNSVVKGDKEVRREGVLRGLEEMRKVGCGNGAKMVIPEAESRFKVGSDLGMINEVDGEKKRLKTHPDVIIEGGWLNIASKRLSQARITTQEDLLTSDTTRARMYRLTKGFSSSSSRWQEFKLWLRDVLSKRTYIKEWNLKD